jgi:hypothetical protein
VDQPPDGIDDNDEPPTAWRTMPRAAIASPLQADVKRLEQTANQFAAASRGSSVRA